MEVRESTHIQFHQVVFVYMIINFVENIIYNPTQSKPSCQQEDASWNDQIIF